MKAYGDDEKTAIKNIKSSNDLRKKYYETISSEKWDDISQYDLCINSENGIEKSCDTILSYLG